MSFRLVTRRGKGLTQRERRRDGAMVASTRSSLEGLLVSIDPRGRVSLVAGKT
jgi:hypothetical protein